MVKKNKLSIHKNKAWQQFSLFIRTRDSIKTTGDIHMCLCVTCERPYSRLGFGGIQAGHFIAGRGNAILFNEEATNGQCYGCNVGRGGAHVEYFVYMEKTYGREFIDELRLLRNTTVKYTAQDYDDIATKYEGLTQALLAPYSILK